MNSEVWIGKDVAGTRPYGYTSFEYDLTPYVTFGGTNVIAVPTNKPAEQPFLFGAAASTTSGLTAVNPVHVPYDGAFVDPSISAGRPRCR